MADEPRKIMTKPLPQILDEIEESITTADAAAKQAREAAEDAHRAGDKAISEATRITSERIVAVEKIAQDALDLAKALKKALLAGTGAVEKKLSE